MQLSPEQDRALVAVDHWLHNSEQQVFRLFGYAGTGKTTLAKYFAEQLDGGRAVFGAFTGKAAYVLRSKGCMGATTIHKLIYNPRSTSKANLVKLEEELKQLQALPVEQRPVKFDEMEYTLQKKIKEEKANVLRPMFTLNLNSVLASGDVKMVVIDECSMVDALIGADLESFKKKILVLGDPAQLPPIKGTGYFTEHKPDFMLTEIHRQARDNPIIALATTIREGKRPPLGQYGTSVVMHRKQFNKDIVLAAGQTLVGKNETRRDFNRRFRELLGRQTRFPEKHDKLVCLRNNHDIGLLNGGIWTVQDAGAPSDDMVVMSLCDDIDGQQVELEAHAGPFEGREVPWWAMKDAELFDYGYALTVHKAQGSQWDDVLVFDESRCFRQNRAQWLYTAITRAAERVTLVVADGD